MVSMMMLMITEPSMSTGVSMLNCAGEDSPVSYRTWYRLGVGVWIFLALLWFGAYITAFRKILKYDEIHKPMKLVDFDDDQRKVCKRLTLTVQTVLTVGSSLSQKVKDQGCLAD